MSEAVATDKEKTFTYLEPGLKKKAGELAKIRARSLSNLIEWLLMREIKQAEQSGELPKTNPNIDNK